MEEKMESKRFWLGMSVMVLVFSVVFVGCGVGSTKLSGKYVYEQNSSAFFEFNNKNEVFMTNGFINEEKGTYSVKGSVLELKFSILGTDIIEKAALSSDKKSFALKSIFGEDEKYIKEK
jgi:hypothetical protein